MSSYMYIILIYKVEFNRSFIISEYRGCPCPINTCPKNVHIGPVTGKAPTGSGPADVSMAIAPPGGAFRTKVRACALDAVADTHGSGKVCYIILKLFCIKLLNFFLVNSKNFLENRGTSLGFVKPV